MRRYEHEATSRRTRPIYFGVPAPDMRRRLIAAHRAMDAARHLAAAEAVAAARRTVWSAVRNGGARPVPEMISAALSAGSLWAAYTWAGPAIALALVAFLAATLPGAALGLVSRRNAAIRTAEDELRHAEEHAREA